MSHDLDSLLVDPPEWRGRSRDPNDLQFGDVVDVASLDRLDELGVGDVALVGEPYDGAVIGRRGASGGPAAIRDELAGLKTHAFDLGSVGGRHRTTERDGDGEAVTTSIFDVGDVEVDAERTTTVQERVATVAEALHASAALPVFLGGDNSLTVGNVGPLLEYAHERNERVGVVNFDAHLDVREPRIGPTSGTPYRQLLEAEPEGGLDGYTVVGARDFETSSKYVEYLESAGGSVISANEVGQSELDALLARVESTTVELDHVYLSVDLDVLDAAVAPGVSAPTPGGLSTRELFSLVRSLAGDERLAGFELVETAPSLDPASTPESPMRNRTVSAAARTVAHAIAGAIGGDR